MIEGPDGATILLVMPLIAALVLLVLVARNAEGFVSSKVLMKKAEAGPYRPFSNPSAKCELRMNRNMRLKLDLFGLGPSEVVIVAVVAGLLYGPDRIRGQLRDSGVKNSVVNSKGLRLEREERIDEMTGEAEARRKKRAWDRVNALLEEDDEETSSRLADWEGGEGEASQRNDDGK